MLWPPKRCAARTLPLLLGPFGKILFFVVNLFIYFFLTDPRISSLGVVTVLKAHLSQHCITQTSMKVVCQVVLSNLISGIRGIVFII